MKPSAGWCGQRGAFLKQQIRGLFKDVWNVPNVLTMLRLLLIPVIVYLHESGYVWWAFGMLLLSGATDIVDGWIARTFHLVSDFGKAIDPIADKLTQIAVLLCLMPMRFWWVVGVLILKECSIGALSLVTIKRTHSVYSAGWYGKLCTVIIYLSMFVLILWRDPTPKFVLIDSLLIAAAVCLSFVKYLLYFTRILREARRDTPRTDA